MTVLTVGLPLITSLVSFVFAALVLEQWRGRRRAFQLVWGLGLVWYGVSAGTEFWGGAAGWSPGLYRLWYLTGALFVAAYLGAGTVYLLARTRFGYFAAGSLLLGGLITLAAAPHYPGSRGVAVAVFAASLAGAVALVAVTAGGRPWTGHVFMTVLAFGSIAGAGVVLSAAIAPPGWALDATTHAPVGSAFPGPVRVLSPPYNIAGAMCLVFGAIFSFYVYMPKRKLLRARPLPPVARQLYGLAAVAVNLVASLPLALSALARGRLNSRVPATTLIALGGFIPGLTSGLERFGVTWSFYLGQLLGVLLIFAGFLVSEEVFQRVSARRRTLRETG
ncbi:MAG: hypothetical protein M3024_01940 [Candidatus Dormibacteraeota bacterium]|nr:hypothetical protein [Candidatus Dormibacteraeota bacterium]